MEAKMKKWIVLSLLMPMMAAAVEEINFTPNQVFAPVGFDNNDNAQIVLDGVFPNTCYKVADADVKIDKKRFKIEVREKALYYKGSVCLYMLVPYFKTLNLGVLAEGQYQIRVRQSDGRLVKAGRLEVARSTIASADDYLYAPVEEMSLDRTGGIPVLNLRGTFTNSCLRIKEVKVSVQTSPNNVVVVQPIAEEYDDERPCVSTPVPFTTSVALKGIPAGRTLVHVRILNGQALNRVLDL